MFNELTKRRLIAKGTEGVEAHLSNPNTVYVGIDPTGPDLHIGHMLPLLTLQRLINAGHKGVVLIGEATAQIGDPSGKAQERNLLDQELVKKNAESISSQIQQLIPNAKIVNNLTWIKNLSALELLRDVGKHFPINVMLSKDSVEQRREEGISFTEFSYQVLQAFDFLKLAETEQCAIQIGGSDQWGNIIAGIELIRRTTNAKCSGFTIPLLLKPDGTKMGKSESGAIWLNPTKTSPFQFFQFWRNTPDSQIHEFLLKLTWLPINEIDELLAQHQINPNLGKAQEVLATNITAIIHGEKHAKSAQLAATTLFGGKKPTSESLNILASELPSIATKELDIPSIMLALGAATSKSQARRDIVGNGITINGQLVSPEHTLANFKEDPMHQLLLLRKGKKQHFVIKKLPE